MIIIKLVKHSNLDLQGIMYSKLCSLSIVLFNEIVELFKDIVVLFKFSDSVRIILLAVVWQLYALWHIIISISSNIVN